MNFASCFRNTPWSCSLPVPLALICHALDYRSDLRSLLVFGKSIRYIGPGPFRMEFSETPKGGASFCYITWAVDISTSTY